MSMPPPRGAEPWWRVHLRRWRRSLLVVVGTLALIGLTVVLVQTLGGPRVHRLKVAVGEPGGESYQLMSAVARLAQQVTPELEIALVRTAGTAESLDLLKQGEVDLAATQSDVDPPRAARLVTWLFPDMYQLIVRADAGIAGPGQLAGRRVHLPELRSGQRRSFELLARHYGLKMDEVKPVEVESGQLAHAFAAGEVEAVFRVRPPHNAEILSLIQTGKARLLPIDQAEAMRLLQPAIRPATMPKGAYRGSPASPARPLTTVSVQRALLARKGLSAEPVRALTGLLFQRRQALVSQVPLAAWITAPSAADPIHLPLHPGARAWYERRKPAFFEEKADYLTLILTVIVLVGSWFWQLRRYLRRTRKNRADAYNQRLVKLVARIKRCKHPNELDAIDSELIRMLGEVVDELDQDRISPESFRSFAFTYRIAMEEARWQGEKMAARA